MCQCAKLNLRILILPVGLDAAVLEKNRSLTEDFTKLYLELQKEGCFEPSYVQAFLRFMELILFAGIGIALCYNQSFASKFFGVFFIMVARARAAFLMHEQGHYSYSGNPKFDRIMQSIVLGKFVKNVISQTIKFD